MSRRNYITYPIFADEVVTELMTEEELERRLFIAKQRVSKIFKLSRGSDFYAAVDEVLLSYYDLAISLEELTAQIKELEQQFPIKREYSREYIQALGEVFKEYFKGRTHVTKEFMAKYQKVINLCCEIVTFKQKVVREARDLYAVKEYNNAIATGNWDKYKRGMQLAEEAALRDINELSKEEQDRIVEVIVPPTK